MACIPKRKFSMMPRQQKNSQKRRNVLSLVFLTNGRSDVILAAKAAGALATVSTSVSATRPSSKNTTVENNGKKRRKNKSIDDFKNEYKGDVNTALTKLKAAANDIENAKILIQQCCAILWVCFDEFHKNTSTMKKVTVPKLLKDAVARTPTFSATDWLAGFSATDCLAGLEPPGDPAESAKSLS